MKYLMQTQSLIHNNSDGSGGDPEDVHDDGGADEGRSGGGDHDDSDHGDGNVDEGNDAGVAADGVGVVMMMMMLKMKKMMGVMDHDYVIMLMVVAVVW